MHVVLIVCCCMYVLSVLIAMCCMHVVLIVCCCVVCVVCIYSCCCTYVCTGKEERLWPIVRLIIIIIIIDNIYGLAHEARLIYATAAYRCSNYKLNIDMQLD